MRKVLSVLVCLFVTIPAFATGDATPTSKGYVDTQMETLQDNLPGAAANTVITTTDTAGETGTKAIYDSTGNYLDQQNALVTAEDANTAIQMAINGELVCREYDPTGQYCYVYDVRPTVQNNILPTGYTALEYLESTGEQYINTGVILADLGSEVYLDFMRTDSKSDTTIMGCQNNANNYNLRQTYYFYSKDFYFYNSDRSNKANLTYFVNSDGRNEIKTTIDNENNIKIDINGNTVNYHQLTNMPQNTLSMYLFANNIGNTASQRINARVYSVYIKNSTGNMAFNGIPARRDSDGELGMYDLVTGQLFTNSGTGSFIAGPDLNVYMPSGN